MKSPTFAPAYLIYFPRIAEIAQKHGYALTVHGSLQLDFDLVAIPWTDTASSAEELTNDIADYGSMLRQGEDGLHNTIDGPEEKPFGRLAWTILLGNGAAIDLSVMPKVERKTEEPLISVLTKKADAWLYEVYECWDMADGGSFHWVERCSRTKPPVLSKRYRNIRSLVFNN